MASGLVLLPRRQFVKDSEQLNMHSRQPLTTVGNDEGTLKEPR